MVKVYDKSAVYQDCSYKQLGDYFDFKYVDKLIYQHNSLQMYVKRHYPYYLNEGPIHKSATWFGTLYRDKIDRGYIVDTSLQLVGGGIGYGLYAEQSIKKDCYVGEYVGFLCQRSRIFNTSTEYCFKYPVKWNSWKHLVIDSRYYGNLTRFINHSDKPNLETCYMLVEGIAHICFITSRDIKLGEQLTFSYGNNYWRNRYKAAN